RHAARRARVARGLVQRGDHPAAAVRPRARAARASRLDRPVARVDAMTGLAEPVRAVSEQTRARYPDDEGFVERDGVRTFFEVYGDGEPTVLFLPTWSIVHSRTWKFQIPWLANHCRVITFDGRGNGRSDRPSNPEAYAEAEYAAD